MRVCVTIDKCCQPTSGKKVYEMTKVVLLLLLGVVVDIQCTTLAAEDHHALKQEVEGNGDNAKVKKVRLLFFCTH